MKPKSLYITEYDNAWVHNLSLSLSLYIYIYIAHKHTLMMKIKAFLIHKIITVLYARKYWAIAEFISSIK